MKHRPLKTRIRTGLGVAIASYGTAWCAASIGQSEPLNALPWIPLVVIGLVITFVRPRGNDKTKGS